LEIKLLCTSATSQKVLLTALTAILILCLKLDFHLKNSSWSFVIPAKNCLPHGAIFGLNVMVLINHYKEALYVPFLHTLHSSHDHSTAVDFHGAV